MDNKQISANVILRLPKYYRFLQEISDAGITRISSKNISEALHITASQVRQDLSMYGGFGQQGYGYDVEYLKSQIQDILGLSDKHKAIIIGGGRIGQALAHYRGFKKENVTVKAIFDIELNHIEKIENIQILPMSSLENYLSENDIDIAVISVQKEVAKTVAETVIKYGVKAIWNFAPTDLYFGENVSVENINMSESLFRLTYKMKNKNSN